MKILQLFKNRAKRAIFNAKTRNRFRNAKAFSSRHLKPVSPGLHHFFFETLKQYVKRKSIKHLISPAAHGIESSELFVCDEKNQHSAKILTVSIIVPNYNHERFLRKRLESIYGQTYRHFEVILLDDRSSDESVTVLEEYAHRYPDITRLIVNETNSGGVFHQWKRGIELARGELIWIAESDDFCSLDLLEKLVPFFDNDAIMLAYAKSIFVQGEAEDEIWNIHDYLSDIDKNLWNKSFVSSAHTLVNEAWAIKNILPNASSAIFRNAKNLPLLNDPQWQKMRICGDWIFYLHIIRGGLVAYTPEATNYYRLHDANTSVSTYSKDIYYQEYQQVAATLCRLYRIETNALERQREQLKSHWDTHMYDKNDEDFLALYNLNKVVYEERKPNIMMVTFALAAGGGETLPIKIANMLSAIGYGVTLVSLEQDDENPGIRAMLSSHIPLLKVHCIEKIEAIAVNMGIEVIHSHHAWVDMTLAALLNDNKEIKMVISTHGMYEMMSGKEFKEAMPLLINRVNKIVYTAEKNLLHFRSMPNADTLLVKIGNALDYLPITPVNKNLLGVHDDSFVVCLVSRAIPEKGWEEAIQSIKKAREISRRDIHLLLIGEGEEYTRLKSIVYEPYIHLLGFKSNIRDYFAASDLGFLPSRFEGESFPLVIIDCLYANKPVLASNIGEIRVMLQKEQLSVGAVFDLKNMRIPIDTVAAMIAKFASDKEYYHERSQAMPDILTQYDPREMISRYDSIYTELTRKDQG
jgi:glycosyltransferase involved in cell wall biosynthesis